MIIAGIEREKTILDFAFKVYFLSCMYTPFIASLIPIPGLHLIDDFVFIVLIPLCIVHLFSIHVHKINPLVFIIPIYILFSCVNSYFSGNDITVILLSIKNIKNIFLFIILICLCSNHTDFIKKNILLFLWLSVPLSLIQFLYVEHQDDITGLFGPKSTSLYSFLVVVYVSVYAVLNGINNVKWNWILFIPVFLNETKITFLLFPLVLVFLLLICGKIRLYHLILFSLTGSLCLMLLNHIYFGLYGYEFNEIFSFEYLDAYLFELSPLHEDVPRFYRINAAYEFINNSSLFNYIFGYGLGSEYVGSDGERLGVVASYFEYTLLNRGTRVQLVQLLIDYGLFGSCLFVFLLLFHLIHLLFKEKSEFNLTLISLIFVMVFSLVYQNMFFTKQLSFILFYYCYSSFLTIQNKT